MSFAGKVWRLLVGVKDALSLAFLLLFFTVLFAALAARPNPGVVREGALLLELDGVLVEESAAIDPLTVLLSQELPAREFAARDLVRAIDAAAQDDRIKAIALDLGTFLGGGQVHLLEVSEAIARFRESGKPVIAHAVAWSDDSLLLAAHASEIWVDPLGGAVVTGPGGENLYFGAALERYGVTANVFRVGTYKSAVEPFVDSAMSPEARENIGQVYAALWQGWQAAIRQARPEADIAMATGDVAGWLASADGDLAEASRRAGLVDRIGSYEDWSARVAELAGADEWADRPGAFAATELDPWLAAVGRAEAAPAEGRVVVVTVAGEITDGEAGPGSAGATRIAELLDEVLASEPRGLIVRIDSPGGTVTGSETIRRAITRFREAEIPVAVSMGNTAASGGYWIATAGQRIFAEPATITGSIGVFAVVPSFERLLADHGVATDGVRTTGLSGQPDLLAGLTPETSSVLQATVGSAYDRFLGLVSESRGVSRQRADELGQGRVWDGGAARQLGLVDQFGGIDEAAGWAAAQAGLGDGAWGIEYAGSDSSDYRAVLGSMMRDQAEPPQSGRDVAAMLTRNGALRLQARLDDLFGVMATSGVQSRCLSCAPVTTRSTAGATDGVGWLARLAEGLVRLHPASL